MRKSMNDLLELAKLIKDEKLRKKTVELLKDFEAFNEDFRLEKQKFAEAYGGPSQFHHAYKGGLLDHTYSVTRLCIEIAKVLKEIYKAEINMDHLICAALLHDLAKVYCFEKRGAGVVHKDVPLDHVVWTACELYARGFPKEVVHCVAAHAGKEGTTLPQTIEAWILFYADAIDSIIHASFFQQRKVIVLLGE